MSVIRFDEILFDPELVTAREGERIPISGTIQLANTDINNPFTGEHKVNVTRPDAVRVITMQVKQAEVEDSLYFQNFWLGGYGSGFGFRLRYEPDYLTELEAFATTDGVQTEFKLYKTYPRPGAEDHAAVRRIIKPVVQVSKEKNGFQLLAPNGQDDRIIDNPFQLFLDTGSGPVEITTGWKVDCKTGIVYFMSGAPAAGILLYSGEHDTPVSFVGNEFTHEFDRPSEIQGITVREILPHELGIAY